jgi:hypothetical protein
MANSTDYEMYSGCRSAGAPGKQFSENQCRQRLIRHSRFAIL